MSLSALSAAALNDAGWRLLSIEESETPDERFLTWRNSCLDANGAVSHVKDVSREKAGCELIASRFSEIAGIFGPGVTIVPFKEEKADFFLSVSPAFGQEQKPLWLFREDIPDRREIGAVLRSASFSLPFVEFVGHGDLSKGNLIVASWDENGKHRIGAYFIDFSYLKLGAHFDIQRDWEKAYRHYFSRTRNVRLDAAMRVRGIDAVARISDGNIVAVVNDVFESLSIDKRTGLGTLPPAEILTSRLIDNKEILLSSRHGFKLCAASLVTQAQDAWGLPTLRPQAATAFPPFRMPNQAIARTPAACAPAGH
ncbi:MAG: hypothetical protein PHE27_05160 [Alphaproteobacteria bacterium]|nr:hypothetical protein [Alphaproteobacteria bacterium]